ncbi:MAG: hypothetical protein LBT94_03435 [Prevotellaceae bacterium]|nr:hypothetical protein [Prevotellaceae bacterium]
MVTRLKISKISSNFAEKITREIMQTSALLNQIYQLPLHERMLIVERTIHSMRMEAAPEHSAALMADEYRNNAELTVFTQLDAEDFL